MRTKALLLTGALLVVAGLTSLQAQTVFSVNAVGYVNVEVPSGFSIIANPLDAESNTVGALFTDVPNGTTIYEFDAGTGLFSINSFVFGSWSAPDAGLEPGQGVYIFNPGTDAFTSTFIGEVRQGELTTVLPAGFSMASSQVPQEGLISTDLAFPAGSGDTVYLFRAGEFQVFSQVFGSWSPEEPTVSVAEGFFVSKAAADDWVRTFSVND
ncbi:MAG TPA: hypothetical protein EYQ50_28650 [Verrucomicrobiales bacterium]|nr:hypothetical protein [Verrucomicrobiales bacterium]HIL70657.1 hypothetical protein [Verrucomicrobiota bacterium]